MISDGNHPQVAIGLGRRLDDILGADLTIQFTSILPTKLVTQRGIDHDQRLITTLGECRPDQRQVVQPRMPIVGSPRPRQIGAVDDSHGCGCRYGLRRDRV